LSPQALLDALDALSAGRDLSREQAQTAFVDLLEGRASEAQIAGLLMGLRAKGETVQELVGCVTAMRRHARSIESRHEDLVDTCGTGGDGRSTANISTLAALVVAGAGVPVAKHGNRSVSSRCGSADLLEALGVRVDLEPQQVQRCLDEVGIGFMFAPQFHPAMRHALPVRRALGVRTILNLLGPLSNPAGATRQVCGVFDPKWLRPFAEVLREVGVKEALVVHGAGMDELDPGHRSRVAGLHEGEIHEYEIDPREAGIDGAVTGDLSVTGIEDSVRVARSVLEGETSLVSEAVSLNAGAALKVSGRVSDLSQGVCLARESLASGEARKALVRLIQASTGQRYEEKHR
jgi:anthranilate phosphoribosyltransferase